VEAISVPGRIAYCPECDSDKKGFRKGRGRKKNESREINWQCSDCGCAGFQSGCTVVVTRDGKQPGSVSILRLASLWLVLFVIEKLESLARAAALSRFRFPGCECDHLSSLLKNPFPIRPSWPIFFSHAQEPPAKHRRSLLLVIPALRRMLVRRPSGPFSLRQELRGHSKS